MNLILFHRELANEKNVSCKFVAITKLISLDQNDAGKYQKKRFGYNPSICLVAVWMKYKVVYEIRRA